MDATARGVTWKLERIKLTQRAAYRRNPAFCLSHQNVAPGHSAQGPSCLLRWLAALLCDIDSGCGRGSGGSAVCQRQGPSKHEVSCVRLPRLSQVVWPGCITCSRGSELAEGKGENQSPNRAQGKLRRTAGNERMTQRSGMYWSRALSFRLHMTSSHQAEISNPINGPSLVPSRFNLLLLVQVTK